MQLIALPNLLKAEQSLICKKEYEKFKKTRPSYTDFYEFLNFETTEPESGLLINVNRISDNKKFVLPLEQLRSKDKKSENFKLIMDYTLWFVNY